MSDFGSDIRRISRYEQLIKLIAEARGSADQSPKDPILGNKIIAYANAAALGGAISGAGGSSGGTPPDNGGTPPDGGVTGKGGSSASDGANSGAGVVLKGPSSDDLNNGDNNDSDGWFDAKSVLDGVKDAFGKSPPLIGSRINSITGLSNGTRNFITHIQDAALSFIPPNSWLSPFGAGADPGFQFGYYWDYAGTKAATPTTALAEGLAGGAFPGATYEAGVATAFDINGDPTQWTYHVTFEPGTEADINVIREGDGTDCSGTQGPIVCPILAPSAGAWTDLGVTQLGWVTPISAALSPLFYEDIGKFVPNPYDVNVPAEFTDGASILDLQTLTGDHVRITPTRDGGWAMYYSDPAHDNLPVGSVTDQSVYLIAAGQKAAGFITPNALAKILPL